MNCNLQPNIFKSSFNKVKFIIFLLSSSKKGYSQSTEKDPLCLSKWIMQDIGITSLILQKLKYFKTLTSRFQFCEYE